MDIVLDSEKEQIHTTRTMVIRGQEQRSQDRVRFEFNAYLADTSDPLTVWYDFSEGPLPPTLETLDMAAIAFYHYAARLGVNIFLEGSVSKQLLENLEWFADLWWRWRPDLYHKITITAETEIDDRGTSPAGNSAILAYSGGVDSSATLVQHMTSPGRRKRRIESALLIHGFDMPLSKTQGFAELKRRVQETLHSFDIPLTVVKTNLKESVVGDWGMEHGAALASCLNAYAGRFDYGLLAEDIFSQDLGDWLPWGNNPLTVPLLSSGQFKVQSDGGELTRLEKVDLISKYPVIMKNLRVCYTTHGNNCGRCEKCVRTQMYFIINGRDPSAIFPHKISVWRLIQVRTRHQYHQIIWNDIAHCLKAAGLPASWRFSIHFAKSLTPLLNHLHAFDTWRREKLRPS